MNLSSRHTSLSELLSGFREWYICEHDYTSLIPEYRTVCYDDLGDVEEDPRWKIFYEFHSYIETRFPKVYVPYFIFTTPC